MSATPTYTPGGTPSLAGGTIATMALRAAPNVSWYRTARAGLYAIGAFIAMIAAFMGMRAIGIGPFGSLLATGALSARDRVIITDFTVSGGDTTLGRVVSDAVRAGLNESSAFTLVAQTEVAAALERMQRTGASRVDLTTARQIAQREGIKAIIDGDVASVGGSYILSVRMVTGDSARDLTSARAVAAGAEQLIEAADRVTRELRGRAGESLRRVQNAPALARVTTGSLEALRKYSEGSRLHDIEGNALKAVPFLREAVAIDSTFAYAWTKLAYALMNARIEWRGPDVQAAMQRAYDLRDRLSERERDRITASYFRNGPRRDRARAIAAYDAMLARGDSADGALGNLAWELLDRREYARAETLLRAGVRREPEKHGVRIILIQALQAQGKLREADSVIAVVRRRWPNEPAAEQQALNVLWIRGRLDDYQRGIDSARKAPDPVDPTFALGSAARFARDRGRLREWRDLTAQQRRLDRSLGRVRPALDAAMGELEVVALARLPVDEALKALDAALLVDPIEQQPVEARPYLQLSLVHALAGRPDRAREWLRQYDTEVTDTVNRRQQRTTRDASEATIAMVEGRWAEASTAIRRWDQLVDGPAGRCASCLAYNLIWLFGEAGMADSMRIEYEAYRATPYGARERAGPDLDLGADLIGALARMYDERGDTAKAVAHYRDFIQLWDNADPEFQPRVADARERLRSLTPVEGPRR
jgi:tetratricopeptide (TPR) repeat protein